MKFKKVLFLSALVCSISTSIVYAKSEFNLPTLYSNNVQKAKLAGEDENLGFLVSSSVTKDGFLREEYSLKDKDAIQRRLLERNHPLAGEDVMEIITVISMPLDNNDNVEQDRSIYFKNIQSSDRWYFEDSPIRSSSYVYPGGTMSVTEAVNVTWSAAGKVSAKIMEAQLGYSHTTSHTVTDSQQISVPEGKRAYVDAFALHRKTTFDVWDSPLIGSDTYEGTGYSYKPNGVRFEIIIN